jgi:DNA polymerase III delta prime subunit
LGYFSLFDHLKLWALKRGRKGYLRGAILITPFEINWLIKKSKQPMRLQIGELIIPKAAEVQHVLLLGRPGAGKTVVISHVIKTLLEENATGNQGLIYDYKGDYVEHFYNPDRDLLFNPVDERCLSWSLFDEITRETDIDGIVASLIPKLESENDFWNEGARNIFCGLLHALYKSNRRSNDDIWKAVSASHIYPNSFARSIPSHRIASSLEIKAREDKEPKAFFPDGLSDVEALGD